MAQKSSLPVVKIGDKRIPITIESICGISNGRFKIKIKENDANLIDLYHEGRNFVTIKNYGRGRYIMREIDLDKEWENEK